MTMHNPLARAIAFYATIIALLLGILWLTTDDANGEGCTWGEENDPDYGPDNPEYAQCFGQPSPTIPAVTTTPTPTPTSSPSPPPDPTPTPTPEPSPTSTPSTTATPSPTPWCPIDDLVSPDVDGCATPTPTLHPSPTASHTPTPERPPTGGCQDDELACTGSSGTGLLLLGGAALIMFGCLLTAARMKP